MVEWVTVPGCSVCCELPSILRYRQLGDRNDMWSVKPLTISRMRIAKNQRSQLLSELIIINHGSMHCLQYEKAVEIRDLWPSLACTSCCKTCNPLIIQRFSFAGEAWLNPQLLQKRATVQKLNFKSWCRAASSSPATYHVIVIRRGKQFSKDPVQDIWGTCRNWMQQHTYWL